MNKTLEITYPDCQIQSRHFIWARLKELTRNKSSEKLVPFNSLPGQYQISAAFLWDCLTALRIEPEKLNEQIYLTVKDVKRLEQFMKRIEISWACPHILENCCRTAKKI